MTEIAAHARKDQMLKIISFDSYIDYSVSLCVSVEEGRNEKKWEEMRRNEKK